MNPGFNRSVGSDWTSFTQINLTLKLLTLRKRVPTCPSPFLPDSFGASPPLLGIFTVMVCGLRPTWMKPGWMHPDKLLCARCKNRDPHDDGETRGRSHTTTKVHTPLVMEMSFMALLVGTPLANGHVLWRWVDNPSTCTQQFNAAGWMQGTKPTKPQTHSEFWLGCPQEHPGLPVVTCRGQLLRPDLQTQPSRRNLHINSTGSSGFILEIDWAHPGYGGC